MTDYTVHITRADDRAWTVTVDQQPDWTFREKNFAAVDARLRELAHTHDGADPAAVTITRARVRVGDIDVTDRSPTSMRCAAAPRRSRTRSPNAPSSWSPSHLLERPVVAR